MATIPMIPVGPVTTLNRSILVTERGMSGNGGDDFICGHCGSVMLEDFDDAYGDVSGYNRRWQIGRCRRVLDGGLGVGAWRPLRLVSVRIPRSSTGNLVSVQGGFC
jgi:hypothetical protein